MLVNRKIYFHLSKLKRLWKIHLSNQTDGAPLQRAVELKDVDTRKMRAGFNSALAMTLKVILASLLKKCRSIGTLLRLVHVCKCPYIVRLWKIHQKTTHFKEPWNGRSWTREKRVLALLSFSHDTQVDF